MKMLHVSEELASRHYAAHTEKPFYKGLVSFITSSPLVALVLEGPRAVEVVRNTMGGTNPSDAAPGTIRGDFGLDIEQYLFENISKENGQTIGQTIYEELALYEPRIVVNDVTVVARTDNNEYKITISITIPSLNNKKGTATGLLDTQGFNYS